MEVSDSNKAFLNGLKSAINRPLDDDPPTPDRNKIDLEENKIPFGLLSKEEQEHLNSWPHGLLILGSSIVGRPIWHHANPASKLSTTDVYRTIPAPKRETVWLAPTEFNDMSAEVNQSDAHDALNEHGGFALRIEFDATTGDNPTIVKEMFDE